MDSHKRVLLPQGSQPRAQETDENPKAESQSSKLFVPAAALSACRRKVLAEKNGSDSAGATVAAPCSRTPSSSPVAGRGAGPYDPKTNYTTPRPEFLRYNPERRHEILLRVEREMDDALELGSESDSSAPSDSASATGSPSSSQGSDSECSELASEVKETAHHGGGWTQTARRVFLVLTALAFSFCCICCMSSGPVPASLQEHLDFSGPHGSMYDAGVRQVNSGGNFVPIDSIGSKDLLAEVSGQTGHRGSEKVVSLFGPRDSPRNFMAIAMMGLSDVCPDATFAEVTCQIGDASSGEVAVSQEVPGFEGQKSVPINESFENSEPSKVASLDGKVLSDSTGSSYASDREESKLGSLNQEEEEDYSNCFELQPVPMDKNKELESEKVDEGNSLESENLDVERDIETELLDYENTAEAAKALRALVEFLWLAMKRYLLQMLACSSVVSFAAASYMYFQKCRKDPAPVSRGLPLPQPVQLPKCPSSHPVQVPVLKPVPSISLEVPLMDDISHNNSVRRANVDSLKASNSSTVDRKELGGMKPPTVELLGEFSFMDAASSRARPSKDSNGHGGDGSVQELPGSLRKETAKTQKEYNMAKSSNVQRARNKENVEKGEKATDATPTPLRRSSRLRDRVTTP